MKSKIIAFDLDDVLCYRNTNKSGVDKYHECKPCYEMIDLVNQCYDNDMVVKIYTARGMETFSGDIFKIYNFLYDLTKKQLNNWGVKHHYLVMGKQHYDILIDDKAYNSLKIKSISDIKEKLKV
jgi:hypothetical protein